MQMTFDSVTAEYRRAVNDYLANWCRDAMQEPQKILYEAMQYSLLAGGKRIRPILVLEFCRLSGGEWEKALPFAAAVEMIHTYSLIHDDLPCMDNDDYRRGRLTNHKVYGEALATLAGDGLLTEAFSQICKADLSDYCKVRAAMELGGCAGPKGMVGGQVLDMSSEERECTHRDIVDIQSRKTGALIRAACLLGTIAANANKAKQAAAECFADHLGLAFQIRDDMLDAIGDANVLGKAVGVDDKKNTFVKLLGLQECDQLVLHHTQQAIDALSPFDDTSYLITLARELTGRKY